MSTEASRTPTGIEFAESLRTHDSPTEADLRELARLNHSGTHSCTGICLRKVVSAFDRAATAERERAERLEAALRWALDRLRDAERGIVHDRECSPMDCRCGYAEARATLTGEPSGE